jgi:hypothetical protein
VTNNNTKEEDRFQPNEQIIERLIDQNSKWNDAVFQFITRPWSNNNNNNKNRA